MMIKTYYKGGHFVAFDTDQFTEELPQPGSLLTNYAIDYDNENGERIWLTTYHYEANEKYKGVLGPTGLPVARRRDGWSFLLVDDEDMKALLRMTIDGDTALIRVGDELVDALALQCAFDAADDVIPKAVTAHDHLVESRKRQGLVSAEHDICHRIGFPHETYKALAGSGQPSEPPEEANRTRKLF